MRLMHVALIAAYIELVAADFCGRAADPLHLAALWLPSDSCLRTFYPRLDPPPPPALVDLPPPALGSLSMHAQIPLVNTRGVDTADNVCLVPSVLVYPLLSASALATVPCGCASAVHASSASSSDDEIWLRDDPRPSSPPVFTPVCSAPVGAEADGLCPMARFPIDCLCFCSLKLSSGNCEGTGARPHWNISNSRRCQDKISQRLSEKDKDNKIVYLSIPIRHRLGTRDERHR